MERKSTPTRYEIQARERIKYIIDTYCDGNQQRLVDICGVNKASISQYVNGKNVPSNITAKKICQPFNINPAWLMGFDVEQKNIDGLSPSSSRPLAPDEMSLLDDYEKLNDYGKEEARKNVHNLTRLDEYKKEPPAKNSAPAAG